MKPTRTGGKRTRPHKALPVSTIERALLRSEFDGAGVLGRPQMSATEDYLHEAPLADDPPSGTFCGPDGRGDGLGGLGVHEHWNNALDAENTLEARSGFELL